MHQSTQRLLCRLVFLAGCVLPTMATLGWIVYRQSGWARESVEQQLTESIGLPCQVAKFYNPKPNKWVFHDLQLEVAGQSAISINAVQVEFVDESWHLALDQVSLDWKSRRRLWETLQESILLDRSSGKPLEARITRLTFDDSDLPPLSKLTVQHDPHVTRSVTCKGFVESPEASPALLISLQSTGNAWNVDLATDRHGLATRWLSPFLPTMANLGRNARYQGSMKFQLSPKSHRATLHGIISEFDLRQTLAARFGQHAAGSADLHIQSAVIQDQRLLQAHGWMAAENGQISKQLLERASKFLHLPTASFPEHVDLVAFRELAVEFDVDHGTMTVGGHCQDMPGILLAGLEKPLVAESTSAIPATNLAKVIYGDDPNSVPASGPSVELARWLSIPQVADSGANPIR